MLGMYRGMLSHMDHLGPRPAGNEEEVKSIREIVGTAEVRTAFFAHADSPPADR